MHFLPILSTLRRHRTAASLIVLEIALTCAIVCNAVFLVGDRLARMDRPSGVAEEELVRVRLTGIGTTADASALTQQDLTALRTIPGVKLASSINQLPFGGSSWNSSVSTIADDPSPSISSTMYMGTPDLIATLGIQLVAGRTFTADEYVDFEPLQKQTVKLGSVIVTRGLAERLYPGKSALGQPIYFWGKEPQTIVGVIESLARPNQAQGAAYAAYSLLMPVNVPYTIGGTYVLRTDPGRRAEVMAAVDQTLHRVAANRIILDRKTFADMRNDYFKQDRAMAYLLVGVSLALPIITALGVIGLASFWVQQRTRQIGVRRALGATRGDILRYFQVENFILASIGIVIGMGLAFAINLWLMHKYQVARLPAGFLPIGAAVLWLLGQIAVLGPALRAAAIPPAIATRSV